jgi:hypothetical protein
MGENAIASAFAAFLFVEQSAMLFDAQGVRWILCGPHRVIEEGDATNYSPCALIRQSLDRSGESVNGTDLRLHISINASSFRVLALLAK